MNFHKKIHFFSKFKISKIKPNYLLTIKLCLLIPLFPQEIKIPIKIVKQNLTSNNFYRNKKKKNKKLR